MRWKKIKTFCLLRSGITPGQWRWSRVRWVNELRILYWHRVMPRRFGTSSSVSMNKEVLNNWDCWWRISSGSRTIHKWTLLHMSLDLRCNSQSWIQSCVYEGRTTYRLNCSMGRSWQQYDLSTRSLAKSGSPWMTIERRTVCLRNCVRAKNGHRHRRQRHSQVHSLHMHHPRSLDLWRTKQRQVNQMVQRRQRQQRKPQLFSLWGSWPSENEFSETVSWQEKISGDRQHGLIVIGQYEIFSFFGSKNAWHETCGSAGMRLWCLAPHDCEQAVLCKVHETFCSNRWQIKDWYWFMDLVVLMSRCRCRASGALTTGYLCVKPLKLEDACSGYGVRQNIELLLSGNVSRLRFNAVLGLWHQPGEWWSHTPRTYALWSQESQRKLTLQRLQEPFNFGMYVLAIKTCVLCESCW